MFQFISCIQFSANKNENKSNLISDNTGSIGASSTSDLQTQNEIKLFSYHLKHQFSQLQKYIHFNPTSCAFTSLMLSQFKVNDYKNITNIIPNSWIVPKEFFVNEALSKTFLGPEGFPKFNKLSESKRSTALDIIASSGSLNDPNTFAEIGMNQDHYLPQPSLPQSEAKITPPLKQGVLKNMILNKYQLNSSSSPDLEKGLRKAAANGEPKDVHFFLTNWKSLNVNAQAPDSKKTALHWASGAKKK